MRAEVKGTTMPVLEVLLDVGEALVSDRGEISWMTANVRMTQTAGRGAQGGLFGGLKRVLGGGSLLLTRFEASGGQGFVAFAAKLPGHIVPLEIAPGQNWIVHRDGWVCGTEGVSPSVALSQSLGGALFGKEGFVLQRLEGQGTAWIELGGELVSYELSAGQQLLVHPGHVGAFEGTVQFSVTRVPGIVNRWAGGDGHWLVALTGSGKVWLQSMPLAVLAGALAPYLASGGAESVVGGGAAGGVLGDILGH
jgi:uncharacterized protein (TIGR00266 family)